MGDSTPAAAALVACLPLVSVSPCLCLHMHTYARVRSDPIPFDSASRPPSPSTHHLRPQFVHNVMSAHVGALTEGGAGGGGGGGSDGGVEAPAHRPGGCRMWSARGGLMRERHTERPGWMDGCIPPARTHADPPPTHTPAPCPLCHTQQQHTPALTPISFPPPPPPLCTNHPTQPT